MPFSGQGTIPYFPISGLASGIVAQWHAGLPNWIATPLPAGFALTSGAITSGYIGNGAVVSGSIASGAVSRFHLSSGSVNSGHLANASVTSGNISSGQISQMHLASGAVNSGQINTTGTPSATTYLRGDFAWSTIAGLTSGSVTSGMIGDAAVVSGSIASGQISQPHIASGFTVSIASYLSSNAVVQSGSLQSGIISRFALASGAVNSGHINTTGTPSATTYLRGDFAWAAVAGLTSGAVTSGMIGNAAVVSGSIASGSISQPHLASGFTSDLAGYLSSNAIIVSGSIAQNAIYTPHIASGTTVTFASIIGANYTTAEVVSGARAVCLTSGNRIAIAQGASGLRMPAIGVNITNALSGTAVSVAQWGQVDLGSGMNSLWSGQIGKIAYVSTSGFQMTSTRPTANIVQRIGVTTSGGIIVGPVFILQSGNAAIQSGAL